jgi:hypothetical protein
MRGQGIEAPSRLQRTRTVWFEGPLIPLPDSQAAEDYPKDLAGTVKIDAGAELGTRPWRVWTAQGVTPSRVFVVGELPEVVEDEIDGEPVPVEVKLPVTVNGRIFPREDVDVWSFRLKKGQSVTCRVDAGSVGSPLDARLEVTDAAGRRQVESDDVHGVDPQVRFTASSEGTYQVRIHDIGFKGSQAHVYRLTVTSDPWVDAVFPLGGRHGSKVKLELQGQGVPQQVEVELPKSGDTFIHRLPVRGQLTNPVQLELDDLPEHGKQFVTSQELPVPAIFNGRIEQPGDIDYWPIALRKGDPFEFDLRAQRLGSPLLAVLAIQDGNGKDLARADTPGTDPTLVFTAPADGTYRIAVSDRFRSRGGPQFAYRLRVGPPAAPDFKLTIPTDALNIPRGGKATLKVTAQRIGGFKEPIVLTCEGLPAGVTTGSATIPANQNAVDLAFIAADTARIGVFTPKITGTSKVGERNFLRGLTPPALNTAQDNSELAVAVTLRTPFKIIGDFRMQWAPRGGWLTHHYRIERNNFDGPIEVALTDKQARHLQGVTGPTITVPAGATEFDYTVQLPPWMEIGRTSRTCVMGSATITEPDGAKHVVTYSSVNQNEQLVAVVEAGQLGLELERNSLIVAPGRTANLTVRLSRSKLATGPVRVELAVPEHLKGISAEPILIPAGATSATFTIRFDPMLAGSFTMPVTLRAATDDAQHPLTAEAKLTLLR